MTKSAELKIPIKAIYQYPVRGIRGTQVSAIKMSDSGPMNDRLWVIIGCKKMKPLACNNSEVQTYLRQEFVGTRDGTMATQVRVFLQDYDLPIHLER